LNAQKSVNRRRFLQRLSRAGVALATPFAWFGIQRGFGARTYAASARPKPRQVPKTATVLAQIRTLNTEFPIIGIYRRPNDQDRQSAGSGMGIYPCDGKIPCSEPDHRSELVYPPFIMATRRQTDSLVRQAYLLLPESIRQTTGFVIADRLIQYPENYLAYLSRKKQVVLIGSFFGIDAIASLADYEKSDQGTGVKSFHRLQLRQLNYAISLIQSLNKPIVDIIYGMGDSITPFALTIRHQLEQQSRTLLTEAGLDPQNLVLDWGADELIFKAFARRLPPLAFKLVMAHPAAKHHYDGHQTTQVILERTLASLQLTPATGADYDAQVFVFDRHPAAPSDFNQGLSPEDPQQAIFDQQFREKISALSPEQQTKTIVIDGRNPNGALNAACLPTSAQFLGFGSWGTFANSCGQTLAMAKLLIYAKNRRVQRQLLLEAIAHDVFCIGYAAVQDQRGPLRQLLYAQNLRYLHKESHLQNGYSLAEIVQVFKVMNQFVNQQMQTQVPGCQNTEFVVIPQLWRTFESQVFLKQGTLSVAGVFRQDLPAQTFNPLVLLPVAKTLRLQDLEKG
jgi:hypothetical protein